MSATLKKGDLIPDFELEDQEGNLFRSMDHKGERPIVVFFYPKDHTPGCTKEVCAFRDQYEDFTDAGVVVVGISADTMASHKRFANKHSLPFPLLSDTSNKVRREFGVKGHFLNLLPGRETFVFDSSGKLVMRYHHAGASGHISTALKAIKGL